MLARTDADGDMKANRSGLSALGASPRAVVRIDQHIRYVPRGLEHHSPALTTMAANVTAGTASPIAIALGSMHGDGYVREAAVDAILREPDPLLVPFLVLRTADWVKGVRDRARAGLVLLLADDPATYLPAVLDAVPLVADRLRGGFVHDQIVATLLSATAPMRSKLPQAGGPAGRRLVIDVGLARGWWTTDQLVQTALHDPDVRSRSRAAEAAVKDAVWTRRRATVDRLAGVRHPEVRAVAVTGLVRLGHHTAVLRFLDDPAPLIRAIARDAARQTGTDALHHYRDALTTDTFTPGTIAGLAETGTPIDADLLRPLLHHNLPRTRTAAVRGFAALDPSRVRELISMLDDPSPAVIREATLALRPIASSLPPDLGWTLLTDSKRAERRRAGYRLLSLGDAYRQLRASLIAAVDTDARLARRAAADATSIVRDATGTTWRRRPRPHLQVSPDQLTELHQLANTAAAALTDETAQQLHHWLDSHDPGSPHPIIAPDA
ncbi:hypothetical protein Raf01_71760 [Rugosimonospora africana]|uniref:HEAT repeat-containing protein n=2 Tax=Rugosimonospora africana TaxID=556532 RepID=A0A8J3QZC1_9ACTN|nr:hypothetical protein Raf01_71760 [Rugosimonospora africana]